ncbi:MAG: SusC/RagA family TonB-linked outer membrane protein [Flavobacteriales bacterium]|nr:MAG: SusC/RagA family TonB-linked outer membrane protein [Flavobacteriales bacterium]
MHKLYKIRTIMICVGLALASVQLKAQLQDSTNTLAKNGTDTLAAAKVKGRFFNTNKQKSTAAISTVGGDILYQTPSPSVSNSLFGLLPGLSVKLNSGEPGLEKGDLNIRGIGTYGYTNGNGYNLATIFVDGFEVTQDYFNYLSSAEIESVSILKDAAALATFGMKGANGVIWVNTKRGRIGKSTITFQTRAGLQNAIGINKPLNSFDFASLYNQAKSNDNGMVWTPTYSQAQLQAYQDGTGTNVDWFDQTLKDKAPYADANLIFSGGDQIARYNIVLDYANKQGLFDVANTDTTSNQKFARYNLRANLDFNIGSIFEASIDLNGRLEDRKSPNYVSGYSTSRLFTDLYNYPSNIYAPYDDVNNINYSGTALFPNNPVASIKGLGWQSNRTRFLQGNFGLKEKLDFLVKGLYLKETFSFNSYDLGTYNKTRNYARFSNGISTTTNQNTNILASVLGSAGQYDWRQLMITAGYDVDFGKSSLNSAINYHQSTYAGDGLFGYKVNYQNVSGRINYGYDDRYVAEFGFSYFGSDAYAEGNRFHFYPSVSAAWVISNENFLKNNITVNNFKLRASAGKSATDLSAGPSSYASGGRYLFQQFYGSSGTYYTGNGAAAGNGGLNPLFLANPNVGPEESMKYNVGLDLTIFKSLSLTVDAYLDKRSGILTQDNSIPSSFGNYTFYDNIGKMTNRGLEVSTSYSGKASSVGYQIFGMIAFNKNKIDFQSEIPPAFSYNAKTGRPFGTQIGLVSDGFYQLEDFNSDGTLKAGLPTPLFGAIQPGDLKYRDLDNNGKIDGLDVTEIGKSYLPTTNYSFGGTIDFKGFDLSVLFQGVAGNSINLIGSSFLQAQNVAFVDNGNAFAIAQGAWAYYPAQGIDTRATATYPRLTTIANANNYTTSSFWIKDGSFLRLRNIELGFSFNPKIIAKLKVQKLRLFVNATNPLTWSKIMDDYHVDPEFNSGYPTIKSYAAGLKATF